MKELLGDGLWCLSVLAGGLLWYAVMRFIHARRIDREHFVICDKADKSDHCRACPHSRPHDNIWEVEDEIGKTRLTCTAMAICESTKEPCQCVPVNPPSDDFVPKMA